MFVTIVDINYVGNMKPVSSCSTNLNKLRPVGHKEK